MGSPPTVPDDSSQPHQSQHAINMKTKTIQISALAALAACVITAPSAKAAGFAYANGDLLVGFRQTGNNTSDYVIDLTKLSASWGVNTLRDATGTVTLNLGASLGTDFATAFGSATPSNVTWGLLGSEGSGSANGDPFRTYYLSEPTGGTTPASTSAQSTQINNIGGIAGQYGPGVSGAVSSGSILSDATNGLTSYTNSWTLRLNGNLGNAQLNPIETGLASTLDLWKLPQGSSTQSDIGTVSFNNATDTLTFNPTPAVPEPATALFGCVGLAVLAVGRRRKARTA